MASTGDPQGGGAGTMTAGRVRLPNVKERRHFWRVATPYLLVAPVVIYYALFWLRPVFSLITDSFTAAEGGFTLENFALLAQDPSFWPAVLNTAIIVIFSVTLEFFIAFGLAMLINANFPGASAFLFVALIPMALPATAVGAMWLTGLTAHGWINSVLYYLGILEEGEKIYFMTGVDWKNLVIIILIDAWTVIPSVMIILLAGLQNLPESAKEAGYVFGGSIWTVFRKITVPMLKPTIQTAVILRLIAAIQIWFVIVILFGFSRLPVLVERVVYYSKVVKRLDNAYQLAASYTIIVTLIVSIAALIFLQVTGAFKSEPGEES